MKIARMLLICWMVFATTLISDRLAADDPVFSGPQVGEKLKPMEMVSVYGETAGTNVDPIKLADGGPTLLVFVHSLTRPGMALTKALTGYALSQKGNGVYSSIVWLDDDKAKAEAYLRRASGSLNFVVPVGVSVDGGEGPGAYGLNRNVELTILVAKDNTVKANYALVQPSVTEASKIAKALASLIDQPVPDQKQLEAYAYPKGMMQRRAMRKRQPSGDDTKTQDPKTRTNELRELMKGLIARDISEEDARKSIKAIEKWVADRPARRSQLAKMVDAVLQRGMGSESVQPQLKKWQQESSKTNRDKKSEEQSK